MRKYVIMGVQGSGKGTQSELLCADLDLVHYGTEADADTIRDTAIAQPLLVASGIAAALALFPHPAEAFHLVGAAAGHSVGELTAAAGTGAITAESAMALVRERGLPSTPVERRPLAEAAAALDDLRLGKVVGRVVLTP